MLRQGVVQDTLTELNTLPHHLPQWSRINTLDKGRYPKPFLKDRLQPLPNPMMELRGGQDSQDSDDRELELSDKMNPGLRVQHLEKSLHFLRTQHQEVLANLHDEIDKLKRENKELNFRIVMLQKNSGSVSRGASGKRSSQRQERQNSDSSHRESSAKSTERSQEGITIAPVHDLGGEVILPGEHTADKMDEIKLIFLEEEIKELKKAVRDEKAKNTFLSQVLERSEQDKQARTLESAPLTADTFDLMVTGHMTCVTTNDDVSELERTEAALKAARLKEAERKEQEELESSSGPLPFNTALNPLQVHLPAQAPRPPTLKECEIIIRHLQQVSDKQTHELNQLKSDLRDVLYSHKWTPDAYLLAKAYIADDDARVTAENENLARVPLKQPNRKLPDIAYVQKDTVSLPPLRQAVTNKAVERRKRTQILQKARLRKEVETADH